MQKLHFSKLFEDTSISESEETQKRMEHRSIIEINALATLVGRVMPVYFPRCHFVRRGVLCYSRRRSRSAWCRLTRWWYQTQSSRFFRRIGKGNFSSGDQMPLSKRKESYRTHSLPEYYVCQVLAEMFVLKTDTLIYIT